MYVMVGFDPSALEGIADGSEFCMQLLNEEGVFVLPGGCFGAPDFFRVVFSGPQVANGPDGAVADVIDGADESYGAE